MLLDLLLERRCGLQRHHSALFVSQLLDENWDAHILKSIFCAKRYFQCFETSDKAVAKRAKDSSRLSQQRSMVKFKKPPMIAFASPAEPEVSNTRNDRHERNLALAGFAKRSCDNLEPENLAR